ncbi:helicase HerA-like domain-containing protein [Leptolyngbya sp. BC1307]|uniref:helicase HerA-like domain-containing protein n=1 Tax=Leptolyngbya sp. BC1307 TaxID=2029589 RepID=UPI000EFBE8FF|nr:helicase HerA-like domain-containing protein [Leptolyngbya sp. BC1307]
MTTEQQLTVFCSQQGLDTFHAITHQHHIWHPDPYDVDTIHQSARSAYERLLNRVDSGTSDDSGRILLLLGESGAGKTHLMRVFRNQTHGRNQGFFSYMQMTSAVSNYARYVLRNTIDSFEKPYYEDFGVTTGLMKISNALAESPGVMTEGELHLLREEDLSTSELLDLIYPVADRVIAIEKLSGVDLDVIRALLYLQAGQAAINAKVLKFLRCEPLAPYDSGVLGGMASRDRDDDPLRMLQSLALLVRAVTTGAFIICLDQLEDIREMESAEQRFRRAMQTIVTIAEIPNVVVVISCLDDFYSSLKQYLPKPHLDRLELDPAPVTLKAQRTADDIQLIIERRLQHLYDSADTDISDNQDPLYPFPSETVDKLAGLPTRRVLDWCLQKREESISTGQPPKLHGDIVPDPPLEPTELSQLWNDHLAGTFTLPESDRDLLNLLSASIPQCAQELGGNNYRFTVSEEGNYLKTDIQLGQNTLKESLLIGLCQKSSAGGALLRQIKVFEQAAADYIPVIIRTTEFPSNPKTQTAQKIGQFLSSGGRRAMVVDSDWRTMLAIQSFQELHSPRSEYQQWLQTEQPLSQLPSFQKMLNLNELKAEIPVLTTEAIPTGVGSDNMTARTEPISNPEKPTPISSFSTSPTLPIPDSVISLGYTRTTLPEPVELGPEKLVRHGAFLGGTGSGKTTLALTLIEQLLLRGIPAILLDRKGDLCSYANPDAWNQPDSDPQLAACRQLLRDKVEVAVYTPGTIGEQGRPLSIAITPPGLGQLPSGERRQIANYCAMALGGILNYKQYGQDKTRIAILGQAIAVLSELQIENPLNINRLIEFISEVDPLLVNAIGVLDPKHCKKLAEDLQTLSLMTGHLFNSQAEQLSADQLLTSQSPQKTPLSIINLGSLGDNANILFWVSQFLLDFNRYAQKHPSGKLQAVVLFDEADLYLPAQGKPSTKEPMESLLKRARSAGIGILLATQSPGDLDYKCRDQISSWFVGKVKENTALNKLKPMLSEAKVDVTSKLANQKVGEFFAIRAGEVTSLKANMSLVKAEQVPLEEILTLAAQSKGP